MIDSPRLAVAVLIAGWMSLGACAAPEEGTSGAETTSAAEAVDAVEPEEAVAEEAVAETSVHAWDCEDDSYIVTEFRLSQHEAVVFLPGETVILPHVASGSGAKYSNGTVEVWNKGDEMMLDDGDGESVNCTRNARASTIESAKLAGYDLWAIGNEPGWQLRIGYPGIVWETDYGQTRHEAEMPEVEQDGESARSIFRAETEGQPLIITLEGGGCSDDMSGESFETRVIIEFGGQTYRGCGQPLH